MGNFRLFFVCVSPFHICVCGVRSWRKGERSVTFLTSAKNEKCDGKNGFVLPRLLCPNYWPECCQIPDSPHSSSTYTSAEKRLSEIPCSSHLYQIFVGLTYPDIVTLGISRSWQSGSKLDALWSQSSPRNPQLKQHQRHKIEMPLLMESNNLSVWWWCIIFPTLRIRFSNPSLITLLYR